MGQNDGDVKIVVGNNFDEIVLDESKDVLLEVCYIIVEGSIQILLFDLIFVGGYSNYSNLLMQFFLQIYAPWCGHCQALEPTYNKLAKHLRSIESLIIAKMDGTTNEHPRAKVISE